MKKILISILVFVSLFGINSKVLAVFFFAFSPGYSSGPANTTKYDYSESISAIDVFLNNPTLENLRVFCTTAKTLPGIGEKKILNDTRTDFTLKTLTLYELVNNKGADNTRSDGNVCARALNEDYIYRFHLLLNGWTVYNPSLSLEFDQNDSDDVRESKILYNTIWNSFSSYKLIGFEFESSFGQPETVSLKQVAEAFLSYGTLNTVNIQYLSFVVPEKILLDVRKTLVSINSPSIQTPQNIIPPTISPVVQIPTVEQCKALNQRLDNIKGRCSSCPSGFVIATTGLSCTKVINDPLPNNIESATLISPQPTPSSDQQIKDLKARVAKLEAEKTITQKIEPKKEIQKTSDDSLTISNTQIVPQKISWWRRIINWIFK